MRDRCVDGCDSLRAVVKYRFDRASAYDVQMQGYSAE
jgi:hypothetical protein